MNKIYFSPSQKAFYHSSLHPVPPADAVEITAEEHAASMAAQQAGNSIGVTAEGKPLTIVRPPPTLSQLNLAARKKIDDDAKKIYADVIGSLGQEYQDAENDARAFAAAGFAGAAGSGVTSWANAKVWTNTQAANDIIRQADAWIGAMDSIRANRLTQKERVKAAADEAALTAVMAQWAAFVTAMRAGLGV